VEKEKEGAKGRHWTGERENRKWLQSLSTNRRLRRSGTGMVGLEHEFDLFQKRRSRGRRLQFPWQPFSRLKEATASDNIIFHPKRDPHPLLLHFPQTPLPKCKEQPEDNTPNATASLNTNHNGSLIAKRSE